MSPRVTFPSSDEPVIPEIPDFDDDEDDE